MFFKKGFKRIRYYGVQATKSFEKIKETIKEAVAKVKGVVQGAVKIIGKKSYRERYRESTGTDPLVCPCCGAEMEIWKIWHPKYGVIYDGFKEILGGKYEVEERRDAMDGKGMGGAVRASPGGVQISLSDMWGGALG